MKSNLYIIKKIANFASYLTTGVKHAMFFYSTI